MKKGSVTCEEAVEIITNEIGVVGTERIPLSECFGRILAEELRADDNVPPFDRSPFDGYAFRAADTANASKDHPVVLKVLEEIAAGDVPHYEITEGTAVRIMTGAPIPKGADTVTMYEITEFTDTEVKLFRPYDEGENIVYAGEDVKKGQLLASVGMKIDIGLMGTLAAQNRAYPLVYKKLKVGIISTGSELIEVGSEREPGKIFDSNQYTLSAAMSNIGLEPVAYGIVKDDTDAISKKLDTAIEECDAVMLTGGASVGDFDLTPEAMQMSGVEILFKGVQLKPGMACSFGIKDGKLVCGLSGNPASSLTTFLVVTQIGLKKAAGYAEYLSEEFEVELACGYPKKSKATRVLKGKLDLTGERARFISTKDQGNVVISSAIGCDCLAFIPAGSGAMEAGAKLKAVRI